MPARTNPFSRADAFVTRNSPGLFAVLLTVFQLACFWPHFAVVSRLSPRLTVNGFWYCFDLYAAMRSVPACFWGWMLGTGLRTTRTLWRTGRIPEAKSLCWTLGWQCSLANGAIPAAMIFYSLVFHGQGGQEDYSNPRFMLLWGGVFNLSLQASLLMLLAGISLPKRERDRVQIGRRLRF